jgi:hypothetical protein
MHLITFAHTASSLKDSLEVPPLFLEDNLDDNDDVYFKKITMRVSQNPILHKNADSPKA